MFLEIENDSYLGIKNTGIGTHIVRKQIEKLLKIPEVEYIKMDAAGYEKEHVKGKKSTFNGYYVWPCMDFNYRFNATEIVITPADGIFWELIGKDIDPDRRDAWSKKKKEK